jgi:hypothetical protein
MLNILIIEDDRSVAKWLATFGTRAERLVECDEACR